MDWNGKFWRGVFSEPDGTPSVTRVLTAIAMGFAIGWITAIIAYHLKRSFEPVLPDLAGLIAFIGTPYAINRGANIFQKRNKDEDSK